MKLDLRGRMRIFDWRNTRSDVHVVGELTRHNIGGLRSKFHNIIYIVKGYIIKKISEKKSRFSSIRSKRFE